MSCRVKQSPSRGIQGYIAVISAVIITAIVIVIALVFSSSNYLGRFDTAGFEEKGAGREVALGCLEHAKLRMKTGAYSGGENINIGGYDCSILPIETEGKNKVIKASSTIGGRSTNLKLTVDGSTLENLSLEEVSGF
ncbi:MAG TPA: hypothetical protein VNK70_02610 [Candidatus Paceibacterota bacterium]|nr:hypothetical protein [Candidatus Paceibacterota bacterium]